MTSLVKKRVFQKTLEYTSVSNPCVPTLAKTFIPCTYSQYSSFTTHGKPDCILTNRFTLSAQRRFLSYPKPYRQRISKRSKKFNFLTSERLAGEKKRLTKKELILRDDHAKRQKNLYRERFLHDVETKIRFFPLFMKYFVFFPLKKNTNKRILFKGNRVLLYRTYHRIYLHVLEQLKKREHRDVLLEQLVAAGCKMPSESEWEYFTDKKGDIKVGIALSSYQRSAVLELSRKHEELSKGGSTACRNVLSTLYYLVHFKDIPTLEHWTQEYGEVNEDELVRGAGNRATINFKLKYAKKEIENYGKKFIQDKVDTMTLKEQMELRAYAEDNFQTLYAELRRYILFSSQVLLAIHALPEIVAIQAAKRNYGIRYELKTCIERDGNLYPLPKINDGWKRLTASERVQYSCFGRRTEARTLTGAQLYIRYCARDYAILRTEATQRFKNLTDLQQAALNFPFYPSIKPPKPGRVAFRKFYLEMSEKYGLLRNANATFGNRLFEAAMRKKWIELSPEERYKYDEDESISCAFPLQPKKGYESANNPNSNDADEEADSLLESSHSETADALDELASSQLEKEVNEAVSKKNKKKRSTKKKKIKTRQDLSTTNFLYSDSSTLDILTLNESAESLNNDLKLIKGTSSEGDEFHDIAKVNEFEEESLSNGELGEESVVISV